MHEDNTSWQSYLNDQTPFFFNVYFPPPFHLVAFASYQSSEDITVPRLSVMKRF